MIVRIHITQKLHVTLWKEQNDNQLSFVIDCILFLEISSTSN